MGEPQDQHNDRKTASPVSHERNATEGDGLLETGEETVSVLTEGDSKPAAVSEKTKPTENNNNEEAYTVTVPKVEGVEETGSQEKTAAVVVEFGGDSTNEFGEEGDGVAAEEDTKPSATSSKKKREYKPGGLKRGVKVGQKMNTEKTQADWFDVCEKYVTLVKENPKLKKKSFLESSASGDKFTGTLSEQQSLGRYLRKFEEGKLKRTTQKRHRKRVFKDIEEKLWHYLDLRANAYKRARCGVSWSGLQKKCLQFADLLGFESFQASSGWLSDTLREYLKEQSNGEPLPMDPEVEAEVQDSIRKMESSTADRKEPPAKAAAALAKDKDKKDTPMYFNGEQNSGNPNSIDVEAHIRALQLHAEAENVPAETRFMLERFAQGMRMHASHPAAGVGAAGAGLQGVQQQQHQDPCAQQTAGALQPQNPVVSPQQQQQQPGQQQPGQQQQMLLPNLMQAQLLQQQQQQLQLQNQQPPHPQQQNLPQPMQQAQQQTHQQQQQQQQQQQMQQQQQQQQPQSQQQQPPPFPNNVGPQMHPQQTQQLPNVPNNLTPNLFQFFSQ